MAIQNRHGNFVDFDPFKMLPGEFAYSLDTEELYYCVAPGNVRRCATKEDIVQILDTNQEAYDGLQQLISELEDETVLTGILADISDLLTKTVQHDSKIDSLENRATINTTNIAENTTNIAENTTNIAENTTNLDDHMLKNAEGGVHGLKIARGSARITVSDAYIVSVDVTYEGFSTTPYVTADPISLAGGGDFVLNRVVKTTAGCTLYFTQTQRIAVTGNLDIEWIAIGF